MPSPVVLLGDSLSVGSFPFLEARVPEAVRFAKSGASTGWMEGQVDEIAALAPRLVMVMGGTNDLVGASPETVYKRLKNLSGQLLDRGVPRVVLGLLPLQMTEGNDEVDALNTLLIEWRSKAPAGVSIEDIGGVVTEEDVSADPMGIHPGPDGYDRMGAAWAIIAQGGSLPRADGTGSDTSSSGGLLVLGLGAAGLAWALSRALKP